MLAPQFCNKATGASLAYGHPTEPGVSPVPLLSPANSAQLLCILAGQYSPGHSYKTLGENHPIELSVTGDTTIRRIFPTEVQDKFGLIRMDVPDKKSLPDSLTRRLAIRSVAILNGSGLRDGFTDGYPTKISIFISKTKY